MNPSPLNMPARRPAHTENQPNTDNDNVTTAPITALIENDLPESMRPGWNPLTPGREAQARFLDACISEGVDPREIDPDGFWLD